MFGQNMKRRLAAMLCMAMLFTQTAGVLAEGVDLITPETTQTDAQTDGSTQTDTDAQLETAAETQEEAKTPTVSQFGLQTY